MCRVPPSTIGCVGFVREKQGAQGHASGACPIRLVSFCMHLCTFLVCCFVSACMQAHIHARMHACSMDEHARMHACMHVCTGVKFQAHANANIFFSCVGAPVDQGDIKKATDSKGFSNHIAAKTCRSQSHLPHGCGCSVWPRGARGDFNT